MITKTLRKLNAKFFLSQQIPLFDYENQGEDAFVIDLYISIFDIKHTNSKNLSLKSEIEFRVFQFMLSLSTSFSVRQHVVLISSYYTFTATCS